MLRRALSCLAGKNFASPDFSVRLLLKIFFFQKMIGFNRSVSWPVHWSSKIIAPENIEPGTRCPGLSMGCHIDGRNGIHFGKNVWIGPRVSIISMNHNAYDYHRHVEGKPVLIADNCWLASNVVVLPGVVLGPHTIVAAGAVVTHSFPDGDQVLAGVPARVVKKLDGYKGKSDS